MKQKFVMSGKAKHGWNETKITVELKSQNKTLTRGELAERKSRWIKRVFAVMQDAGWGIEEIKFK